MGLRILVFGADSMVGSHFVAASPADWDISTAGRTDPRHDGLRVASFDRLDLSDRGATMSFLDRSSSDVWVNFAARTDVDGCERERQPEGTPDNRLDSPGSAWNVNGLFPGWAAARASSSGRFLVHVSTDYVFDGTRGPYSEEDEPSGLTPLVSWYGYTKGVGERNASGYGSTVCIVRIAHPYRARFPKKLDFARAIIKQQSSGTLPRYYQDQTITPSWIPDVTDALQLLIHRRHGGTVHVGSPEPTSPWEFASTLLRELGLDAASAAPGTFRDGAKDPGRAPRPERGGLALSAIDRLGVHPRSFREGIHELVDALRDEGHPTSAAPPP
ncbi:MAG: sugar nucleotide-binding protein [Thermoplasmata archaeon]|nr:sugar nucleotide-binding protein [Thermoplasmata archaeon]